MGFRVAQTGYKTRNSEGPSLFLPKILRFLRTFLELIGKPFYLCITWVLVGLFALLWFLGKITILLFKSALQLPQQVKSYNLPQQPHILRPKFPLPKLKLPTIQLVRPLWLKLAIVFLIFTVGAYSTWLAILKDLPKPDALLTREQAVTTKIYDRNGRLLYKIYRNQNRTLLPLDQIPEHTRLATIAIEDSGFYSHPGVSLRGITRAIWRNVTRGQVTGGSTITQQLVKNTLLTSEKTVLRKAREIVLAIQVETTFSKDQILGMYLNEVSYGGSFYGIEEAAQGYFGKKARDLTLAEGALLAGLPKAPTTFSPFGAHPEKTRDRQLEVLVQMVQLGFITPEEADAAAAQEIVFAPQRTDIKAPHFVMYLKQYLAEKYGEDLVELGGLEVYTSLDLEIQEKVEEVVRDEVARIRHLNISNAATLVTNPATGEILAMAGSKDYWNVHEDGNVNVTVAPRQPGSSIKPVNYSWALENKKYTAASVISDTPITYHIRGSEPYTPHNYNNAYRGNVTLRSALASSLNVPAVKVLASYGVSKMIYQGQIMGITTWNDPRRFGLSLTLGGGEVKMTDMNVVYGVLANYGKRVDLNPVLYATDYKGRLIEENICALQGQTVKVSEPGNQGSVNQKYSQADYQINRLTDYLIPPAYAAEASSTDQCGSQVLDPRVAFILTDILRDNSARTPTFGPRSLLVIPDFANVAAKTGTTQNLRDNWTIGYTQDYVVSTWVGNNDNRPMSYVASGVTGATPIWHNITRYLLEGMANHPWVEPEHLVKAEICPATGTLACAGCGGKIEYFIPGTEPKNRCVPKSEEEKRIEEERKRQDEQR